MNFITLEFLLFFPLVLLLHRLLPARWRWVLLLGASWLFYAWWDPRALLLLLGTTAVSYLAALRIRRLPPGGRRRAWRTAAAAVSLGVLAVFKYANFFLETGWTLAGNPPDAWRGVHLVLPVGISFYTFQTLSYVLDVYRGTAQAETHFGYYALYVSFFPQLVAGPIERSGDLLPQLHQARRAEGAQLYRGLWLILRGFFKKLAIADRLAPVADAVYAAPGAWEGPAVLLATAAFALQIYCDFSGYSDIAQGTACMLGIRLRDNFRKPYQAESVRDFWRRWHISLTDWFTDYLYKPLGGSRQGTARQCLCILLVFLASGLWHGAAWHFVAWGAIHGLYLTTGVLYRRLLPRRPLWESRTGVLLRRTGVFLLVCFAWIFFRAGSLADALTLVRALASGWSWGCLSQALARLGLGPAGLASGVLLLFWLSRLSGTASVPACRREGARAALACFYTVLITALSWLYLLSSYGESAFLYFQF